MAKSTTKKIKDAAMYGGCMLAAFLWIVATATAIVAAIHNESIGAGVAALVMLFILFAAVGFMVGD